MTMPHRKRARAHEIAQRNLRSLIEAGRAIGGQSAAALDANYGSTRPAELWVVDRAGGAEAASLLPDFERKHARNMAQLHRRGPAWVCAVGECERAAKQALEAAEAADVEAQGLAYAQRHHRYSGQLAGLARWAYLILLSVADLGLLRATLELYALDSITIYMVAASMGLVQVVTFHLLGERMAGRADQVKDEGEKTRSQGLPSRQGSLLKVVALASPALLLAVFVSVARGDLLELQVAKTMGFTVTGTGVGYGVAVGTSLALMLAADAAAFLLGRTFGEPKVKDVLGSRSTARRADRHRRVTQLRADRAEARFQRACEQARAWCNDRIAEARKTWDFRRVQSAAVYAGITLRADRQTAAVMSETEQLVGCDAEAHSWLDETVVAILARRDELDVQAEAYLKEASAGGFGRVFLPAIDSNHDGSHKGDTNHGPSCSRHSRRRKR